jgi:hypothetical protein
MATTKEQIALEVTSTADTGGIEKASQSVEKLSDSQEHVSEGFSKSQASVVSLNSAIELGTKAFGAAKEVIDQTLGRTLELAEGIDGLSQNLGISAVEASKLTYATSLVGIEQGQLEAAMTGAIRKGITPNLEGLKQLSAEYLAMEDPIKRSQFLMQTFGKQGLAMGDLLERGAEGIDALSREAEQYGVVLDDNAIEATKAFNMELKKLESRADAVKAKIGMALVDVANTTVDNYETIANAASGTSQAERDLRAGVIANTIIFGDNAKATRDSAQALTEFLIKQQEASTAFDVEDMRVKNLDATKQAAHAADMVRIQEASTAQDRYYAALAEQGQKAFDDTKKAADDLTLGMKDLTKEFIYQQAVQNLSPQAAMQVAQAMGLIKTDTLNALDAMRLAREASDVNKDGFINAGTEAQIYANRIHDIEVATRALQGLKAEVTITTINEQIMKNYAGAMQGLTSQVGSNYAQNNAQVIEDMMKARGLR